MSDRTRDLHEALKAKNSLVKQYFHPPCHGVVGLQGGPDTGYRLALCFQYYPPGHPKHKAPPATTPTEWEGFPVVRVEDISIVVPLAADGARPKF